MSFLQFRNVWKFTPKIQIAAISLLYILYVVFGYQNYQETNLVFGYPLHFLIFFAPIYEEIIFRGYILESLTKRISARNAIIFSSVLFGLWHLKNIFYLSPGELTYQILYTALFFGPLMAYITIKTKSIWISVILHYLNNLASPLSWTIMAFFLT